LTDYVKRSDVSGERSRESLLGKRLMSALEDVVGELASDKTATLGKNCSQ